MTTSVKNLELILHAFIFQNLMITGNRPKTDRGKNKAVQWHIGYFYCVFILN